MSSSPLDSSASGIPVKWTMERIEKFLSDNGPLKPHLFELVQQIDDVKVYSPHADNDNFLTDHSHASMPFEEIKQCEFVPTSIGDEYGPTWSTHWFRLVVPISDDDNDEMFLFFNANGEALVYAEDGAVLQGLTGPEPFQRHEVNLNLLKKTKSSHGSPSHAVVFIEVACNGLFGAGKDDIIGPPDMQMTFKFEEASIKRRNRLAWDLYYDVDVIFGIAKHFGGERPSLPLHVANEACNTLRTDRNGELIYSSVENALKITSMFFKENKGSQSMMRQRVHALGNCHIDTAWLWPYAESVRKCARSWSTAIALMEEYDLHFCVSQAQQCRWMKESYPELWHRMIMKQKQKQNGKGKNGKLLFVGGSWVENDSNIPNCESLIRQFLYGQRFFKEELGEYCEEFWLPDSFGYCAQTPQILKGVGISAFLTQKMSWNMFNKFPHHTFKWKGLDGSSVVTHFPPTDTYCSAVTIEELKRHVTNYERDAVACPSSLLLYGVGDGGGGPTRSHLERLKRLADVDGLPLVSNGDLNDVLGHRHQSLTSSSSEVELRPDLPEWNGELYLEMHRGCATSQALTKKWNRASENMLHRCELWCSVCACYDHEYQYPYSILQSMWEKTLLNQFHDVLPGSSIEQVYIDAQALYCEIEQAGKTILEDCYSRLSRILNHSPSPSPSTLRLVLNSQSFERVEWVRGVGLVKVPSFGWTPSVETETETETDGLSLSIADNKQVTLENRYLSCRLSADGEVMSMVHRHLERECVPAGETMNSLHMYADTPLYWDAWDLSEWHKQQEEEMIGIGMGSGRVAMRVESDGKDGEICVEYRREISPESWIRQTYTLNSVSPYITISSECEWRESHKVLKASFPINVNATEATYEIQGGVIKRPTHSNTRWDAAKYEVYAQRFADLSDANGMFGVSILNDCKHGYSACDNVVQLSLLRSPKKPDANCDMGRHHFKYAIYPHSGQGAGAADAPIGEVVRAAASFNDPLHIVDVDVDLLPQTSSFLSVSSKNINVQCIKFSEDRTPTLVVRYNEFTGGVTKFNLDLTNLDRTRGVKSVKHCNMLEDIDYDASASANASSENEIPIQRNHNGDSVSVQVVLEARAFGIGTIRIELGKQE